MAGGLRSDDPNRSNDERRRDEQAWASVHGRITNAVWRRIDRAVADAAPAARERGLLVSPWQVFLWGDAGGCVTVQPSGEWEFGSVDAKTGLVNVLASSSQQGRCDVSMADARYLSFALTRELHRDR